MCVQVEVFNSVSGGKGDGDDDAAADDDDEDDEEAADMEEFEESGLLDEHDKVIYVTCFDHYLRTTILKFKYYSQFAVGICQKKEKIQK